MEELKLKLVEKDEEIFTYKVKIEDLEKTMTAVPPIPSIQEG